MKYKWLRGILWAFLLVAVGTIYLFYYHTPLFWRFAEERINHTLAERSNVVFKAKLSGSLGRRNLTFTDVRLATLDALPIFYADRLSVAGDLNSVLGEEHRLDSLSVNHFYLNTPGIDEIVWRSTGGPREEPAFVLDVFTLDSGEIVLQTETDPVDTVQLNMARGSLWLLDGFSSIHLENSVVQWERLDSTTVGMHGILSVNPDGALTLSNGSLESRFGNVTGNFALNDSLQHGNVKLHDFRPRKLMPKLPDLALANTILDAEIEFTGAPETGWGLRGRGELRMDGSRHPVILEQFFYDTTAASGVLHLGPADRGLTINLHEFRDPEHLQIRTEFKQAPILEWFPEARLGSAVSGSITYSRKGDSQFAVFDLNTIDLGEIVLDSIATKIDWNGELGRIETLRIHQSENDLSMSGTFTEDGWDLNGSLVLRDLSHAPSWRDSTEADGEIDLKFALSDSLLNPRLTGNLTYENLGWGDHLRLGGVGKVEVKRQGNTRLASNIVMRGTSGLFEKDTLREFSLSIQQQGAQLDVEEVRLRGDEHLLVVEGTMKPDSIRIPRFTVQIRKHRLNLVDSLKMLREANGALLIEPALATFDMGGIALGGSWQPDQGLDLELNYEMVDVGHLAEFFGIPARNQGIATGTSRVKGQSPDLVIQNELILEQAELIGFPGDRMEGVLDVHADRIDVDTLLIDYDGGRARIQGTLPWGYKARQKDWWSLEQNYSLLLRNYNLHALKMDHLVGVPVSARVNGSLTFRGTPSNTRFDGRLTLAEARFDTIDFNTAYAAFEYEDQLITFDSLSFQSNWGYAGGSGFLPLNLEVATDERPFLKDYGVGLDMRGEFSELPFLSRYLGVLDGIQGTFQVDFGMNGPLGAPIRFGKIRGHDATASFKLLATPITNIHTELTLVDNTMVIDHFSGKMPFLERSEIATTGFVERATDLIGGLIGVSAGREYAGNLKAEGRIDFSTFFRPRFDVQLSGDEIYYRSPDGGVEAIADASIRFTGQDTLEAKGELPIVRAGYFSDFSNRGSYEEAVVEESGERLFKYSLNALFPGNLLIENDQLEAEFDGDLWLLDYGDGELRFSGTLTALEGGQFFYLGNALEIVTDDAEFGESQIVFNPVEFNPTINIVTQIEIEGELIRILLQGDFAEPELVIYPPSGSTLNQSDVFAYLTISQKVVEEGFDATRLSDPVESYVGILVEKQLERYGKQVFGLDIVDLRMEGSGNLLDRFTDPTAQSSVLLGQRVSKNLKVTYEGAMLSGSPGTAYDFGLEYQVNRNFSITSKIDQDGLVQLRGRLRYSY